VRTTNDAAGDVQQAICGRRCAAGDAGDAYSRRFSRRYAAGDARGVALALGHMSSHPLSSVIKAQEKFTRKAEVSKQKWSNLIAFFALTRYTTAYNE
jgi:hypothetical protein